MFRDAETIKRSKLSDGVVDYILQLIREERLQPGDRIPPERDLSEAFAISRASVRDAIRKLELFGYLEVRQGDGTHVRLPDGETISQPFRALIAGHAFLADDLLEFRIMIEPQLAALAASRRSEHDVEKLRALLKQHVGDGSHPVLTTQMDLEFHQLIAEIAGNQTVLHLLGALHSLLVDFRERHLLADRPELGLAQHAGIAEAIIAGDAHLAKETMREHLSAVGQSIHTRGDPQ